MVKKENSKTTKTQNKLNKKVDPEELKEEVIEKIEEKSHSDEDMDVEGVSADTIENKKSRITNIEKNIETLEVIDRNTGVIYIGHLPWGFDDSGIKKYFEQFGKITRIIVPRSKKVKDLI